VHYFLALLSAFFYSLNQIYNKRLTLLLGSLPSLVVVYIFLTLFDGIFCFLFGSFSIPNLKVVLELLFLSLVGTISIFFLFESFKKLPVGVAITLANFSPIFLTVLVFLSKGTFPKPTKVVLIVLLILTLPLFFEREDRKAEKRYVFYPLITAFGWGVFGLEVFRLVNDYRISPFAVAFYSSLFMWFIFLLSCLWKCNFNKLFREFFSRLVLKWSFLSGIYTSLGFISSVFAFKGISPKEAPVIEAIFTFTTPLGTLSSFFLLEERLNKRQLVGVTISFILLVLFFLL